MHGELDHRTLWKAKWSGVIQLAKFLKIEVIDDCPCVGCKLQLIKRVLQEVNKY